MPLRIIALTLFLAAASPSVAPSAAPANDPRLLGVWKTLTYFVDGKTVPMHGLFIFSPTYYSAAVRFKLTQSPHDDANGNSGPYTADGKRAVFTQWVQVHLRPGSKTEPILSRQGPDEATDYTIDGKTLTMTFPSGNKYVLEKIAD